MLNNSLRRLKINQRFLLFSFPAVYEIIDKIDQLVSQDFMNGLLIVSITLFVLRASTM